LPPPARDNAATTSSTTNDHDNVGPPCVAHSWFLILLPLGEMLPIGNGGADSYSQGDVIGVGTFKIVRHE
jgi:hypothetical protein